MEEETYIEKLIRLGDELADAIEFDHGDRESEERIVDALNNWRMVADA